MPTIAIRDARESDRVPIRDATLSAYQEYADVMPAPHWEIYRQSLPATLSDVRPAQQINVIIKGYRLTLDDRASQAAK